MEEEEEEEEGAIIPASHCLFLSAHLGPGDSPEENRPQIFEDTGPKSVGLLCLKKL